MSVHFMSQSVDWATPAWLYEELNKEFHFDSAPFPSALVIWGANG